MDNQPQNDKPDNANAEPTTPTTQSNNISATAASSITSLVTGIIAIVLVGHLNNIASLFCAIAALAFGVIALTKRLPGKGRAIAGVALGGCSLFMLIYLCLVFISTDSMDQFLFFTRGGF